MNCLLLPWTSRSSDRKPRKSRVFIPSLFCLHSSVTVVLSDYYHGIRAEDSVIFFGSSSSASTPGSASSRFRLFVVIAVILTSESHDSVAIRFNGSNYSIWAYAFKVFVQCKSLLGYLDGTKKEPAETATNLADIETWRTDNARVLSWLIGSVETPIALTFRLFDTAAQIWSHLQTVYTHVSSSQLFDLEYELANLTQGEQTINQYYMDATRLWKELDLLKASKLTASEEAAVLKECRKSRTLQFLMKLRPEFESVRAQLLSSDDLDIDEVLGELSHVEIRLCTQTKLDSVVSSLESAFTPAISSLESAFNVRPYFSLANAKSSSNHASASGNSSSPRQINYAEIKCRHCGVMGHSGGYCKKRNFCNYYKKSGHIIPGCPTRARRSRTSTAATGSSFSVTANSASSSSPQVDFLEATIERMVQAALGRALPTALNAAFATIGMIGNSSSWLLHSAAFNLMSGDRSVFQHYKPVPSSTVEVANGDKLSIKGVGTVVTPQLVLSNTLHIPALVSNLVSVGQLTDVGCVVSFGPTGCVVQDQQTK
ncbi:Retrovirus-related Pol polyprotein from transposon RE1 [Linum grandiflorum]